MSALAAAPAITEARELDLPPIEQMRASIVSKRLKPEGKQHFLEDILEALSQAHESNDLRVVQDVVTAWYRTAVVRSSKGYAATLRRARRGAPRERITLEEAKRILGSR